MRIPLDSLADKTCHLCGQPIDEHSQFMTNIPGSVITENVCVKLLKNKYEESKREADRLSDQSVYAQLSSDPSIYRASYGSHTLGEADTVAGLMNNLQNLFIANKRLLKHELDEVGLCYYAGSMPITYDLYTYEELSSQTIGVRRLQCGSMREVRSPAQEWHAIAGSPGVLLEVTELPRECLEGTTIIALAMCGGVISFPRRGMIPKVPGSAESFPQSLLAITLPESNRTIILDECSKYLRSLYCRHGSGLSLSPRELLLCEVAILMGMVNLERLIYNFS